MHAANPKTRPENGHQNWTPQPHTCAPYPPQNLHPIAHCRTNAFASRDVHMQRLGPCGRAGAFDLYAANWLFSKSGPVASRQNPWLPNRILNFRTRFQGRIFDPRQEHRAPPSLRLSMSGRAGRLAAPPTQQDASMACVTHNSHAPSSTHRFAASRTFASPSQPLPGC